MSYCIYLRKSRTDFEAELQGEGETLARHERILLNLAKSYKLIITSIYKEIVSADTISARPVMQQLLSEIEKGVWSGVLVMEVERLARGDTIDQGIVSQAFKYSKTKIITPTKIYDPNNEFDEEYFEFGLFMSRREYKTINRRLQRGRLESVKEGKYVGNIAPYGYERKKLQNEKGYSLEILSKEADIVKLIFEMYTKDNKGVGLIVRKLNELRIKPRKNDMWVPATIQSILKNPVYIGKIRWNARPSTKKVIDGKVITQRPRAHKDEILLVDGLHSPIIDVNTFSLAQQIMESKSCPAVTVNKEVKNPLAGLVICGICGHKMIRRPYTTGQPDTLMCPLTSCDNISAPLYLVERRILENINEWLNEYELKYKNDCEELIESNTEFNKKIIDSLNEELKKIYKQIDNIHNLLEQGVYTPDIFLQRSKLLSERILEVQNNKDAMIKEIEIKEKSEIARNSIVPKFRKFIEVYKITEESKEKNKILKQILNKVTYLKSVNGRWHNKPDNFEITIYPKIPE